MEQGQDLHPLSLEELQGRIQNSRVNSETFQAQNQRAQDLHPGAVEQQEFRNQVAPQQEIDRARMSDLAGEQLEAQTANNIASGERNAASAPLELQQLEQLINKGRIANTIGTSGIVQNDAARRHFEEQGGDTSGFQQPLTPEETNAALLAIFSGDFESPMVQEAAMRSNEVRAVLSTRQQQ